MERPVPQRGTASEAYSDAMIEHSKTSSEMRSRCGVVVKTTAADVRDHRGSADVVYRDVIAPPVTVTHTHG